MPREQTDRTYLLRQYRDGSNLGARITVHERFSTNPYGFFRWYLDQVSLPDTARVLELGSGTGQLWVENADRIHTGWHVTLTDLSPGILAEAESRVGPHDGRFEYRVADAQHLPFPDAQFDAVFANFMLYHVADRQQALAEIRRVLLPDRRLYAATLGKRHMRQLDDALRAIDPSHPNLWRDEDSNFSLDRGAIELQEWFDHVDLRRYEDGLAVTEAEPLVAYVASGRLGAGFMGATERAFRQWAEQEIAAHGAVRIEKDSGVFVVW